jgi:hypothetical protein
LLHAFFDESGTHNQYGNQATLVSGFIAPDDDWKEVNKAWIAEMKGETFHYKNFALEEDTLNNLAEILSASTLSVVSAGFRGNWDKAISHGDRWSIRFPSCYHMVFEMCVNEIDRLSAELWGNEPVAIMFSRQNEYAKRAEDVWRTATGNGLWPNLAYFGYGSPEDRPELQMADMIAHETFQCLKDGSDSVWQEWPLVKRLLQDDLPPRFGGYHSEETFIEMMKRSEEGGRKYLKTVLNTSPKKGP